MREILRLTHDDGKDALVIVGRETAWERPLAKEEAIRARTRHAGVDNRGCEVYTLEATDNEEYVAVIKGNVTCHEGAVVAATERCERNNHANLVILGPHAVVEVEGFRRNEKRYLLYSRGVREECGNSAGVLVALGIGGEAGTKQRATPAPPAASARFLAGLQATGHDVYDIGTNE